MIPRRGAEGAEQSIQKPNLCELCGSARELVFRRNGVVGSGEVVDDAGGHGEAEAAG